jgi:hypothetical protein
MRDTTFVRYLTPPSNPTVDERMAQSTADAIAAALVVVVGRVREVPRAK